MGKRRGFTLLGMLWVIVVVVCMALTLFTRVARAADEVTLPAVVVPTVATPAATTTITNPGSQLFQEIFSWFEKNGIGGGAYFSNQAGETTPVISVQLGQSEHNWLKWGALTPLPINDEENILKAVGPYGALNLNKIWEKITGKYPASFESGFGYSELYYFEPVGVIDEGWDGGPYLFFQKPI